MIIDYYAANNAIINEYINTLSLEQGSAEGWDIGHFHDFYSIDSLLGQSFKTAERRYEYA